MFAGGVTDGDVLADGDGDLPVDGDGDLPVDGDGDADVPVEGDGEADGDGLGAASETGAASARDARVAEVTSRDRLTVCFMGAGTTEKVPGTRREVPPPFPPPSRNQTRGGDTEPMLCSSGGQPPDPRPVGLAADARCRDERSFVVKLSRPVSWFLLAFGVWSWVIWVTFVKNLVKDGSGLAFDNGDPTAYFWVHLTLAIVSFVWGTVVGAIGLRGLRALRRTS